MILVFTYLTHKSREAQVTFAVELVVQIHALVGALRTARVAQTLIYLRLTLQTHEARPAVAHEPVKHVHTRASVLTRVAGTVVDEMLTMFPSEAKVTAAGETGNQVSAGASVLTRGGVTLVDVDTTPRPCPAWLTHTLVGEQAVHTHTMVTRGASTQIYLLLTSLARESSRTITLEVIDQVSTGGT